jgi:tRNA(Arg) A34 adenosine deaminase TadA
MGAQISVLDLPPQQLSRIALMQAALRQAAQSKCRFPMGAVLAQGNRVVASSSNKRRNSPVVDFLHSTFHAEESVLRRVRTAKGATLYVARIDALRRPAMAKPCHRCQQALLHAGIRRVLYTSESGTVQGLILFPG